MSELPEFEEMCAIVVSESRSAHVHGIGRENVSATTTTNKAESLQSDEHVSRPARRDRWRRQREDGRWALSLGDGRGNLGE